MFTSTVAGSMLLLNAILIGHSLAHPISSMETQEPYSTGLPCTSGPLGMEGGAIPDDSITASSYHDSSWLPKYARLNVENGGNNFWIPRPPADSWIQVDLGLPGPAVTGLIVQGHASAYVSAFSVQYSDDGESDSWKNLVDTDGDTIRFNGNVDGGQQLIVTFPVVLRTKFLRILLLTWVSTVPRLDFEVLGCRVNGLVRLAGGNDALSGRVEIYHDDGWGAVCDTNWDFKDATTVCRQLGFLEASEAKNGSYFGATELPIVMDRVACKGSEPYLSQCSYICTPNKPCTGAAGVVCKQNEIRLVGPTIRSGRIEINVDGTWGTICDKDWDITDAGVVCRQLGFSGAEEAKSGSFFGQGSGPNLMDAVICDGSEDKITDCPSHCWDKPKCNNTETAGVSCIQGWQEVFYIVEARQ